jgi:hypothetical protein
MSELLNLTINTTTNSTAINPNPPDFGLFTLNLIYVATPAIAILATLIITIYTNKVTTKNLILQLNQNEIINSNKELLSKIKDARKSKIMEFLSSPSSVYIQKHIKLIVGNKLKTIDGEYLTPTDCDELYEMINEYLFSEKSGVLYQIQKYFE